jgi:uncharacterized paraquat-inducible protein A
MFTRRKLNSITYGPRLLTLIGFLTIVVPVVLHLGVKFLSLLGIQVGIMALAIPISIFTGIGLFALFAILLAIEFIQDRLMDRRYNHERNKKLKNSDGSYECQYCGCRKVRVDDKRCPVCGQDLI